MVGVSQSGPYVVPSRRSVTVGRYTLDVAQAALVCGTEKIPLRPQVLRVIEAVAAANGKVPRRQLGAAIWGPDVPEHLLGNALDQVISDARATLAAAPDLRLERSTNGYWLKVLALAPPPTVQVPAPGDKFPLDHLLEPHVKLVNCELADLECIVAAPETLELKPRFARATFEHMAAGARVRMLLPTAQLDKLGRLFFQLIASDLPDDGKQGAILQERLDCLFRRFRLSIVDDTLLTGIHLRVYSGGMDRDAVAVVLPSEIAEGVVYSRGIEASQLYQRLQAKTLAFGRQTLMIELPGTADSSMRAKAHAGLFEDFELYAPIVRQLVGGFG